MPSLYRVSLSFLAIGTLSCQPQSNSPTPLDLYNITDHLDNYYDLVTPEEKYFLPYVLAEISGLSYLDNSALTVDDEKGRVFIYDFLKKDITHAIEFSRPDDYEGVEMVGDTVYVLRSDGDVYKFPFTESKKADVVKIETILGKKNDTEGLGVDLKNNTLLIACKEDADVDENTRKVKGRAVYQLNLDGDTVETDPRFTVSKKDLLNFWTENRDFTYDDKRIKFKPSGIAIHPLNNHIYLLSSVGKLLVILNESGEIIGTLPISPRILSQPEGICFSPKGDLYISSEGEGDRGYILKFKMKTKK